MIDDVRAGGEALRTLMLDVSAVCEASFPDDFQDTDPDPRNYVEMCSLVEQALSCVTSQSTPAYRQGFVRALADLLCRNGDGCGVDPETWNPLASSEPLFSAPGLAAAVIHRAAAQR